MTNWSNVKRGLTRCRAGVARAAAASGRRRAAAAAAAPAPEAAGRPLRRDELDVAVRTEHAAAHACRSRPKRSAIQRAGLVRRVDEQRAVLRQRRSAARARCQAESGTARRSSARIEAARRGRSSSDTGARTASSQGGERMHEGWRGPEAARGAEYSKRLGGPEGVLAGRRRANARGKGRRSRTDGTCRVRTAVDGVCTTPCATDRGVRRERWRGAAVAYPVRPARLRRAAFRR